MSLRWQDVGECSHALDTDRTPEPYEMFRALCGRWCEVWPEDTPQQRRWWYWGRTGWLERPGRTPCRDCDVIWAEIDDMGKKVSV